MNRLRGHDLVVVGAGPAGLAAAAEAGERGRTVLVLDQALGAGGQLWRHAPGVVPAPALAALLRRIGAHGGVVARRASVVDAPAPGELVVDFDGRLDRIVAPALVLATGAVERLLPFPGWTLPGVVGVGGLQALTKAGLALRGRRVVLAGSGPLLLPVAATVVQGGGELALIAEQASRHAVARFAWHALASPARLAQAVRLRLAAGRAPYRTDSWVMAARGGQRLEEVELQVGTRRQTLKCEWLGAAAGLAPRTELAALLGCALDRDGIVVDDRQATTVPGVWAAGECCGVKGEGGGMAEGAIAGRAAAGDLRGAAEPRLVRARDAGRTFARYLAEAFAPREALRERTTADTVLCRCEDISVGAIDPGWSQRQAKLWTRVGMGACQGLVCGVACETLHGWDRNAPRSPLGAPPLDAWARALTRPQDPPTA